MNRQALASTHWRRRVFKPALWIACLTPIASLVYDGLTDNLTANPVEKITNTTGIWTLRLVVATIAISPLRWVTGWNQLIQYRRAVGLFAFFYGSLHFMTYFILDHQLQFDGLWEDVVKRPYITAGFTGFTVMIPLALTSTTGWIRRLGGRRWHLLHRLVYVTAGAAVLHYFWKVKLDTTYPVNYAIAVGLLLGWRAWRATERRALGARVAAVKSRGAATADT